MLSERVSRDARELRMADSACQQLADGYHNRRTHAKIVRDNEEIAVTYWFNHHLRRRRHSGRVIIDYNIHELDLEVWASANWQSPS